MRHQRIAELVEGGAVGIGPPVTQRARGVGLGALIVEAMADLVADHPADRAVIDRDVVGQREERALEDARREHDLVLHRVVIGVHRLRQHAPFGAVDRLAELGDIIGPLPLGRGHAVGNRVAGGDGQPLIGFEVRAVADLGIEARQLGAGLGLGFLAHPFDFGERFGEREAQVDDQFVHRRLVFGREVARDIFLADQLAQQAFGLADGALPARALLGRAAQGLAVEFEVRRVEPAWQDGGVARQEFLDHPRLERCDRGLFDQAEHARQAAPDLRQRGRIELQRFDLLRARRHLAHNIGRALVEAGGGKDGEHRHAPGDARHFLGGDLVIGQIAVAADGAVPRDFAGDAVFEGVDHGGLLVRIGVTGLGQQEGEIGLVGVLDRHALLAGVEIVVAVGHPEPAKADIGDMAIGLLGIDIHRAADRAGIAGLGPQLGQIIERVRALDRVEIRLGRSQTRRFDRVGIEIGLVGIDDALFVGREGGGVLRREIVHDRLDIGGALFAEQGEGPQTAEFGRQRVGVDPALVGIGVEVVARLDVGGEQGRIEAPGAEAHRRQGGTFGLAFGQQHFDAVLMGVGIVIGEGRRGERKQAGTEQGCGSDDHVWCPRKAVADDLRCATLTRQAAKGCGSSAARGHLSKNEEGYAASAANCRRARRA